MIRGTYAMNRRTKKSAAEEEINTTVIKGKTVFKKRLIAIVHFIYSINIQYHISLAFVNKNSIRLQNEVLFLSKIQK